MTRLAKYLYKHRKYLVYLPLIVHWLAILILTSLPSDKMPGFALSDKLKHFSAYFVLSVLLTLALKFQKKWPLLRHKYILFVFIIGKTYSTFDELHQMLIPGRSAEFLDWLANLSGITLGVIAVVLFLKNSNLDINFKEKGTELSK